MASSTMEPRCEDTESCSQLEDFLEVEDDISDEDYILSEEESDNDNDLVPRKLPKKAHSLDDPHSSSVALGTPSTSTISQPEPQYLLVPSKVSLVGKNGHKWPFI